VKYRVKVDGKTVWKGEGDDYKAIPAEYRDRPADGEPAHYLYEETADGEQLFGVQAATDQEV
jgi:hypothetical protein